MNVDTDALAKSFHFKMESGQEQPITKGALLMVVEISLLIEGKCIPSHYAHKIHSYIQGMKHQQYLQQQHEWDPSKTPQD